MASYLFEVTGNIFIVVMRKVIYEKDDLMISKGIHLFLNILFLRDEFQSKSMKYPETTEYNLIARHEIQEK